MNAAPPLHLAYDSSPPPARSYSRVGAIVAWCTILLCLGTIGYENWRAARTTTRQRAVENIQLLITSRLIIGESELFSRLPALPPGFKDQLASQVQKSAKDPHSKLRLATVVGELQGKTAALAQLPSADAFKDQPDSKADLAALRTIYTFGPQALAGEQRDDLIRNQGWFGKLALSFGQSSADPLRHSVLQGARHVFLVAISAELCILGLALIGFVLLVITLIRLADGRVTRRYRPAPVRTSAFIESFAIYLGGYLLLGLSIRTLFPKAGLAGSAVILGWVPLAMIWPLIRGIRWAEFRTAVGWHAGQGVFREAACGLLGYLIGLPIVILAALLTIYLTTRSGENAAHPIMFSDTHSLRSIIEIFVLASVLAPLIEETMFRGALFNHLRQWHGWLISASLSAFIFAALHPQGWAAIPVLGSIGFIFAGIREWRGSFIASTTAHALNNTVVLALMVLMLR